MKSFLILLLSLVLSASAYSQNFKWIEMLPPGSTTVPTRNGVMRFNFITGVWEFRQADAWVELGGGSVWGTITGTLSDQTDLQTSLDSKWSKTGSSLISGPYSFGSNSVYFGSATSATLAPNAFLTHSVSGNNRVMRIGSRGSTNSFVSHIQAESNSGTDVSIVTLGTGTSSGITKGLTITSNLTGFLFSDDVDLTGGYYKADYSTNGIANRGLRWIPDLGHIKNNFLSFDLDQDRTITSAGNFSLSFGDGIDDLSQFNVITLDQVSFSWNSGSVLANSNAGLRYGGDYSGTYDARSLTDKAYVDAKVVDGTITNGEITTAPSRDDVFDALALKQDLDSDLTDIASLSPSNDDVLQRKAGAWTNRTLTQVTTDVAALPNTFVKVFHKNLTPYTVTNTTSETIISEGGSGILIPANTIQAGDKVKIEATFTTNGLGAAAVHSSRFRVNTHPTTFGTVIALQTCASVATAYYKILRTIIVTTQTTQTMWLASAASNTDISETTAGFSSHTIDFSVDQYLQVTVDPNATAHSITLREVTIYIER